MLTRIIKLGCNHTKNKTEERKVIQTNLGALISIITVITFYITFLFIDNHGLHLAGLVQLPYLFLLCSIPWLNHLGFHRYTNWLLFFTTMATAFTSIIFAHGTILWVHHFFLLFALLPLAFFTISQWKSVMFIFIINFSLYCYFAIYGWPNHPEINNLSGEQIAILRGLITGFCILAIALQLIISEYHSNKNEQQLQYFADVDALTGINNRRIFIEQLKLQLNKANNSSKNKIVYLLIFDLDFFKKINDTAGHYAGDKTLIYTAQTLSKHIKDGETFARIGGEEFAMLLHDKKDDNSITIEQRANEIREHLASTPLSFNGINFTITTSIGICQIHQGYQPEDVLKTADNALYKAKEQGRNCVVKFEFQSKNH